jgi:hypothetical protein
MVYFEFVIESLMHDSLKGCLSKNAKPNDRRVHSIVQSRHRLTVVLLLQALFASTADIEFRLIFPMFSGISISDS